MISLPARRTEDVFFEMCQPEASGTLFFALFCGFCLPGLSSLHLTSLTPFCAVGSRFSGSSAAAVGSLHTGSVYMGSEMASRSSVFQYCFWFWRLPASFFSSVSCVLCAVGSRFSALPCGCGGLAAGGAVELLRRRLRWWAACTTVMHPLHVEPKW